MFWCPSRSLSATHPSEELLVCQSCHFPLRRSEGRRARGVRNSKNPHCTPHYVIILFQGEEEVNVAVAAIICHYERHYRFAKERCTLRVKSTLKRCTATSVTTHQHSWVLRCFVVFREFMKRSKIYFHFFDLGKQVRRGGGEWRSFAAGKNERPAIHWKRTCAREGRGSPL